MTIYTVEFSTSPILEGFLIVMVELFFLLTSLKVGTLFPGTLK